jgi:hypothetical protein
MLLIWSLILVLGLVIVAPDGEDELIFLMTTNHQSPMT